MSYATHYNSGVHQSTSTKKTKTIIPSAKRVRLLDEKAKGCERNEKRRTAIRPHFDASHAFLNCTFLPRAIELKRGQTGQKSATMESDFYKSLSLITDYYHLVPTIKTQQYDYPYNITLAFWDVEKQLREHVINFDELSIVTCGEKIHLRCQLKFNTNATLFYIPVIPLYRMLKDKSRRKTAQLLLSAYSYLYKVALIPYYRDYSSYLNWIYEMHEDWFIDANMDNEEEMKYYKTEFNKAYIIGDLMQKIHNVKNLEVFEKRLNGFKSTDQIDKSIFDIASKAYYLFKNYPNHNVFGNAPNYYDQESENVSMEKYISFVGDIKGDLFERMEDTINAEFGEMEELEEPTIIQNFNGSDVANTNLEFENLIFPLLNELCYHFYKY